MGTEVAVTVDDPWHIGSDTKAMTAVVLAKLVDERKLDWTSTLGEIFSDLDPTLPEPIQKISLRQLLTHRSGIPPNTDWRAIEQTDKSLTDQRRDAVRKLTSLTFWPETEKQFSYSNWNYVVAAAMAEKVSHRSWEELIKEVVFQPLQLTTAGFGGTGTIGKIDAPWPHLADGRPALSNGPRMDNARVMAPAGGVHLSLRDWGAFVADQLRGARGQDGLLPAADYRVLQTPAAGENYAFGWGVVPSPWAFGLALEHDGSNTMNYALARLAPKRDFAVLICTNQGGAIAGKACEEAFHALVRGP